MADAVAGYFVPQAPPVAPLPAALAEAFGRLPAGEGGPGYRQLVLGRVGVLPRRMRLLEREMEARHLHVEQVAQLWLWAAYLEHVRGMRADTTVEQYVRSVARFFAWANTTARVDHALRPADFDSWQKWLALELKHGATWRMRQVVAVRGFYEWRATRGIGENLAADVRGPRESLGMPRKYTTGQLRAMLAEVANQPREQIRVRDKALLLFLLSTGARREEVSRINLRDVHLGQRSGLVRLHGKGAKEREVSFEGPVVEALREWLLVREALPFPRDPDALFVGVEGIGRGSRLRPRAIERRVSRYGQLAGLREWGVHRFRVTFATAMYDDGVGIEEIRLLMGHESIETTRRYLAVSERMRRSRLAADRQHEVLGTRKTGGPRWLRAALGGGGE